MQSDVILFCALRRVMLLGILVCCMLLGYLWFSPLLWEFHTVFQAFITLVRIMMTHVPFLPSKFRASRQSREILSYVNRLLF